MSNTSLTPDQTPASPQARSEAAIRSELARLLRSPAFVSSPSLRKFLIFLVDNELAGQRGALKESYIGHVLFGKPADYDPKVDSSVRVNAQRLRLKLDASYLPGETYPVQIRLEKGSYSPSFRFLDAAEPDQPAPSVLLSARPVKTTRRTWVTVVALLLLVPAALVLHAVIGRSSKPAEWTLHPFSHQEDVLSFPAFSPDGGRIAYTASSASSDGQGTIFVQAVGSSDAVRMTEGTGENNRPAWSPDGSRIAFIHLGDAVKQIWIMSVADHSILQRIDLPGTYPWLCEVPRIAWARDQKTIFTSASLQQSRGCRLVSIDLASGAFRQWTKADDHSLADVEAAMSPDSASVAFLRCTGTLVSDLFVLNLATGTETRITKDGSDILGFSWMPDGRHFIVASKREQGASRLWQLDRRTGAFTPLTDNTSNVGFPNVSPSGRSIVFSQYEDQTSIRRVSRLGMTPVIDDASRNGTPRTSPDGKTIVFSSDRSGAVQLWLADSDGAHPRQLTNMPGSATNPAWSSDGANITFECRDRGYEDLCSVAAAGGIPFHLTSWSSIQLLPEWSSNVLYFISNHAGVWNMYAVDGGRGEPRQLGGNGTIRVVPLRTSAALLLVNSNNDKLECLSLGVQGACANVPSLPVRAQIDRTNSWDTSDTGIWYLQTQTPNTTRVISEDSSNGVSKTVGDFEGHFVQGDRNLSVEPGSQSALVVVQGQRRAVLNLLVQKTSKP